MIASKRMAISDALLFDEGDDIVKKGRGMREKKVLSFKF
jgi:hypothetical protein